MYITYLKRTAKVYKENKTTYICVNEALLLNEIRRLVILIKIFGHKMQVIAIGFINIAF